MALQEFGLFIGSWLRSPLKVGAVTPSSDALAKAMAREVDLSAEGIVVELGPGTGAVTRALLRHGVEPERLLLVERDAHFCHLLHGRFPGVRVVHGDAGKLGGLIRDMGSPRVSAIVSSLPLLSLGVGLQREILRESFSLLDEQGRFVQYTYGFASPVHPVLQRRLGVSGHPVTRVVWNIPPAVVWRYGHISQGTAGAGSAS